MQFELKRAIARAVRILVALAIGGAALGLLMREVLPISRPASTSISPPADAEQAVLAAGRIDRVLQFSFVNGTFDVTQQLLISSGDALCKAIGGAMPSLASAPERAPLEWALGWVTVDRRWLPFRDVRFVVDAEKPGNCTLSGDTVAYEKLFKEDRTDVDSTKSATFRTWSFAAHETRLTFVNDGTVTVIGMSGAPYTQDQRRAQFLWKLEASLVGEQELEFRIRRPGVEQKRRAVRIVLSGADEAYVPVLTPLLRSVLLLFSCVLFLWLRSRRRLQRFERYFEIAIWLAVVFLLVGCAQIVDDAFWSLKRFERLNAYYLEQSWLGTGAIAAAFAGVSWAILVLASRGKALAAHPGRPASRYAFVTAILATAGAVATAFLWYRWRTSELLLPIAGATSVAACAWIAAEASNRLRAVVTIVLAVVAAGVYAANGADPLIVRTVAALLAGAFFIAVFVLARRGFFPSLAPRWRLVVCAVLLALAWLVVARPRSSIFWTLSDVIVASEPLTELLLLVALLLMLRALSRTYRPSPLAQLVGFVLLIAYLYRVNFSLFNAVVIVLAVLILRWWLFVRRRPWGTGGEQSIRDTVRAMILASDAERATDGLRRTLQKKVAAGELSWVEYESKVRKMEAAADRKRSELAAHTAARAAFANGPMLRPWERGVIAARDAAILAIPWFLLYFSGLTEPSSLPGWLWSAGMLLRAAVQWPLTGFVFGYFYPLLRGENGLSKGLWYFGAMVVPALTAIFLFSATSDPPSAVFVFWFLQLFIQSIVLGVMAGDYLLLKQAGLRWRHLRDVHNLGVLTAYGSSVIVAIGAALSTTIAKDGLLALLDLIKTWVR